MYFDNAIPWRNHVGAVQTLAEAGIAPPAEWDKLVKRWHQFAENTGDAARAKLTHAIVNGTKADTDTLYALALAEAGSNAQTQAAVRNAIEAAVLRKLHDIYSTTARDNYTQAAARFNTAAAKLTGAAKLVDIEADPEQIVGADEKIRTAWTSALLAANELSAAVQVLTAAAQLAGIPITAEATIALCVRTGGHHRRKLWEAWDTSTGRTGRWGAILALGAEIAAAELDDFQPYGKPPPIEHRIRQVGRGMAEQYTVDPCDAEHAGTPADAEPAPKRKPLTVHKFI